MDTNWQQMTPAQKLEARFQTWASAPGIQFATPEAECAFKECTLCGLSGFASSCRWHSHTGEVDDHKQ